MRIFSKALFHITRRLFRALATHTHLSIAKTSERNIIWFNPPCDKSVSTNIGKNFLNLIAYHFARSHKYHKIFNKNTVKASYSCLSNIKSIITAHNKRILTSSTSHASEKTCNNMAKQLCPMNKNCLASNVIYEATIVANKAQLLKIKYIGLSETT